MRKFLCSVLLLITFATPSHAVIDPFSLSLGGSAILHAGISGVIAYFTKPNTKAAVTSSGALAQQSSAVWFEMSGITFIEKRKDLTVAVKFNDFKAIVGETEVSTPLHDAFFGSELGVFTPSPGNPVPTIGQNTLNPYNELTTVNAISKTATFSAPNCLPSASWGGHSSFTYYVMVPNSCSQNEYYVSGSLVVGNPPVTYTPKTNTQVAAALASPNLSQQSALDNTIITGNDSGSPTQEEAQRHFIDGGSGAIWSDGSTVLVSGNEFETPPNAINAQHQALAETAQVKLTNYNNASTAFNASPTSGNGATLDAARLDFNNAVNLLNNALGASGIPPSGQVIGNETTTPVSPTGTTPPLDPSAASYGTPTAPTFGTYSGGSSFDFGARFQSFFDRMKTTAVFSLPNQFATGIPSGGQSTMSFNGGRFGNQTFDFATFSGLFIVVKSLFLIVCSWVALKIISKGGA